MEKTNIKMRLTAIVLAAVMALMTPVMALQSVYGTDSADGYTPNETVEQADVNTGDQESENNENNVGNTESNTAGEESNAPAGENSEKNDGTGNEDLSIMSNGEEDAEKDGEVIEAPASYLKQNLVTFYENDKIILPEDMPDGGITVNNTYKGLKLSLTEEQYSTYRFKLKDTFDFSGNRLGRISVDGLADKKLKADVSFYLDDETEPVATIRLGNQMGKNGWVKDGDKTVDVLNKNITGQHKVTLGITVTGKAPGKKMDILLRSIEFVESGNQPVLYFDIDESMGTITAMNGDPDHQTECYGDMTLQVPSGYSSEYGGNAQTKTYELEYIRGRGNSTWIADKKPYKIKLDKKSNLLGMGSNKHWILLANRYDNTMLRNKMTYWLGEQLGMPYTPQLVPVDVVMNGKYYGSYFLSEQVRIGTGRIEIDDLEDTPDVTTEPEITGGYLLSMDVEGLNDPNFFITERENHFRIESPEFEGEVNETQLNYIKNYVQQTENAIYGKKFKDKDGKSYTEYLDLDAAVDYFWIQEFSQNGDAYASGSTYLYKPRSGPLHWGPLWDFDFVAWGNLEYDEQEFEYFMTFYDTWFERMLRDPAFSDKVKARWPELKSKLEEVTKDGGWLDQQEEIMTISQRYDNEKWGSFSIFTFLQWWGIDDLDIPEEPERSYHEEIEQLRSWIKNRSEWVDKNLDQLTPMPKKITFKVNSKTWKTKTVMSGDKIGSLPTPKAKKGYVFAGWYRYGSKVRSRDIVYENMTLQAKFVSAKKIVAPKQLYVRAKKEYLNLESSGEYIKYTVMPYSPVERRVTWTSSDKTVATVDKDGQMIPHKVGVTTITGKLSNGVKTSFKLQVWSYDDEDDDFEYDDIYVNRTNLCISQGLYRKLTLNNAGLYGNVTWESFDKDIATVNNVGVVRAKKQGVTYLVCTDDDGALVAKCKVTVGPKISATYLRSVTGGRRYANVKWKARLGKVAGYQIRISKDRHFSKCTYRTVKGSRSTSAKISKLSRKTKYYVSIRTYSTIRGNKFYSGWSKAKAVRTR